MDVKNLNGMPDHRANLARTGFDTSQEFAFTSSVGMILPVYQDFLNVGESVHFSGDLITRTQPLVTAAMCDVDVWLDWFFVPASMLFTLWPSKRWLTNDLLSDMFDGLGGMNDTFPVYDIEYYLTQNEVQEYGDIPNIFYNKLPYGQGFECIGKSSFRLANHFGFNPYGIFKGDGGASTDYANADNPNVFPLFPLAYQAIFQDYYRVPLDDFVKRNISAFNTDSYFATDNPIKDENKSLFALHYRPRHFDYFTGFKISPLLSTVNMGMADEDVTALLSKIDSYLSTSNVSFIGDDDTQESYVERSTQTGLNISEDFSGVGTAQLRNMFAVEKLVRVTGRAKKDYDSQVLAHFGFKVPHDVKHELTHICQQHTIIHIGEVISTSDTFDGSNGSSLGAIGGKGYGVINSKKPYRFTAPVDGIFMCCYSSAPRQRYFGTFDKQNCLTDRLSFYQPEFDKLGMQPLFEYEAKGYWSNTVSNRVGWQYRYEQWKRKYNRVSEAFAAPDLNYQRVNNNVSWVNATRPFATAFGYAPQSNIGVDGRGLFVQPTDINQIMVVPYDWTWSDEYLENAPIMFYTDPFIHAFRANVKKVSTMSSFGEPDLNGI